SLVGTTARFVPIMSSATTNRSLCGYECLRVICSCGTGGPMLRNTQLQMVAVLAIGLLGGYLAASAPPAAPLDQDRLGGAQPLPAWNDGPAKKAIADFVTKVTMPGGREFVPVAERIAVFDNDGTLWCEQPMYVQLAFALDRVKALAGAHPDWKDKMPFRAALDR